MHLPMLSDGRAVSFYFVCRLWVIYWLGGHLISMLAFIIVVGSMRLTHDNLSMWVTVLPDMFNRTVRAKVRLIFA